jgi:hypothetical protein
MGVMKQQQGMKMEQLTEQSIQQRLNHFFASYKYKADGLYVFSWESDKLIWTKSGYIYEFEIKISRSDFKNDFKHKKEKHIVLASTIARDKAKEIQMSLFEQKEQENRHWSREMLERRYGDIDAMAKGKRMPNYFYYAVPTGMLEPDEVPPYAGLIYIDSEYRYVKQSYRIVKEAPQLHKTKYTDAELNLGEKFYYNWQTALRHQHDAAKRADTAEGKLQRELDRQHHDRTWEDMECDLEYNKERSERYSRLYYEYQHNALIDRQEIRLLRRELLKLQPDFDYKAIEQEAERYHGKRAMVE